MANSQPSFDQSLQQVFDSLAYANDFRRKLDAIESRHKAQTEGELITLRGEDLVAAAKVETWLEERARARRESAPMTDDPAPISQHKERPRLGSLLDAIDQSMAREFQFDKHGCSPCLLSRPAECLDHDKFIQAVGESLCLSHRETQALGQTQTIAAFYHSQRGCLVDASFGEGNDPENRRLIEALRQYLGMKWVWGFWMEQTPFGRDVLNRGLYAARMAALLHWPLPPNLRAASEELRLYEPRFLIAEQGWQHWLWVHMALKARSPLINKIHIPQDMLSKLKTGDHFPRVIKDLVEGLNKLPRALLPSQLFFGMRYSPMGALDLLKFILTDALHLEPPITYQWLKLVEDLCARFDTAPADPLIPGLRAGIGRLYMRRIEASLSIPCVPTAGLIAFNIPPTAAANANPDHRLDPNTRLALISGLDTSASFDSEHVKQAAWEKFRLDAPEPSVSGGAR